MKQAIILLEQLKAEIRAQQRAKPEWYYYYNDIIRVIDDLILTLTFKEA
jgi:hypothetical protein